MNLITLVLLIGADVNDYNQWGIIISEPFQKIIVKEDKFAELVLDIYKTPIGYVSGVSFNGGSCGYGWGGSKNKHWNTFATKEEIIAAEADHCLKYIKEFSSPKKAKFIIKLQELKDQNLS